MFDLHSCESTSLTENWIARKQDFDDTIAIHPTSAEGGSGYLVLFASLLILGSV